MGATPGQWSNLPENTVVDIRRGGPGNAWEILDLDGGLGAMAGGGQGVTSRWGRGKNGGYVPRGSVREGNPERFTGQVTMRLTSEKFLTQLRKLNCYFDIRVRQKCDDPYNLLAYTEALTYQESAHTSRTYSAELALAIDATEADMMRQLDISAITEDGYKKLRHDNIQQTTSDFAFNKVRNISSVRCDGSCGVAQFGEEQWVAVTDSDNTPGYASNPAPLLIYTTDNWTTRGSVYIPLFPNGNAVDVVKVGDLILVACPTVGVAYARWQDIVDGVPNPNLWTLATGFTAPAGANALAVSGSVVLAVCNGGVVKRSTDGGFSFTTIDNGATTTENLNDVEFATEMQAWAAGDNGCLLRIVETSVSRVIVQDSTGTVLSANINVVAVPDLRTSEVYLGTVGGQIWRTRTSNASKVIFEVLTFVQSGNGQITDLVFAGYKGDVLFVIQTNSNNNSRVLRDLSGGLMGTSVEVIGDYTSPVNNKFNSIAVVDQNRAITVGETVGTPNSYGWIGRLTA